MTHQKRSMLAAPWLAALIVALAACHVEVDSDALRPHDTATAGLAAGDTCAVAADCDSGLCGAGHCIEETVLSTGFFNPGTGLRLFQLKRVTTAPGRHVYVQWFPPKARRGSAPAIVLPVPYDGVSWTGEPVDEEWASRPGARAGYAWPDEEGPGFDPATSSDIFYLRVAPRSAAQGAQGFLMHDVAVLQVFSRFYAGRSMQGYIDDVVAGLRSLAASDRVRQDAIGVYGISLGGFQAVYGAAQAPASVTPARCAAWAPPLDLRAWTHYVEEVVPTQFDDPGDPKLAEYRRFMDPYLRRVFAAAGGAPHDPAADYAPFTTSALASDIRSNTLLMHDAWDTLVPISTSQALTEASPLTEGFWFPHSSPIDYSSFSLDHQQVTEPIAATVVITFTHAFLLTGLLDSQADISLLYEAHDLSAALEHLRHQQRRGAEVSWLIPRLLELADPRVVMYEWYGAAEPRPGNEIVGEILNRLWTAGIDPLRFDTEVETFLTTHGLPEG